MFKKELADVLKQTAWFLAAALGLTAALPVLNVVPRQPFGSLFATVFQIDLLFWALFLGASTFGRERGQRALEYVLSLPYSRRALLLRLAGARLIVWMLLWAVSSLARHLWAKPVSLKDSLGIDAGLIVYGLALFALALSLAPLIENFIVLCLSSIFIWLLMFPMRTVLLTVIGWLKGIPSSIRVDLLGRDIGAGPAWLILNPVLYLILPFTMALLLSIPKFDIRASFGYAKKYLAYLGLGFLVCFGAAVALGAIASSSPVFTAILTPDHHLVQFDPYTIHIKTSLRTKELRGFILDSWPVALDDGRIVYSDRTGLFVLDAASGENRMIYKTGEDRPSAGFFWVCGKQILFFSTPRAPRNARPFLYIVDLDASDPKSMRKIAIPPRLTWVRPFGTAEKDGKRFWLFLPDKPKSHILRIWEDGRIQDIFDKETIRHRSASYINGLIILHSVEGMAVYRDHGDGVELVKRLKEHIAYYEPWDAPIHDNPAAVALYGKHDDHIARLDLKTLEITDIAPLASAKGAVVRAWLPDRFVLLQQDDQLKTLTVSMIRNDRVEPLKTFSDFEYSRKGRFFDLQIQGLVFREGGITKAYPFDDMQELIFK